MAPNLFQTIYNHPLINAANLQEIISLHQKITLHKSDFLLAEGKTANAYYLVEKGLIRFYVNDFNGNEITTQFIRAFHLFHQK